MTPQQAHELLTQVTAALNMTRQQHAAVMQALEVLKPRDTKEGIKDGSAA